MAAATRYKVKAAAVVLKAADGADRYLYRGAPVEGDAFDKESIEHALSAGLVEKVGAQASEK